MKNLFKILPLRFQRMTGFTIVELMIVVAIMGTLVAIGVPSYQRYIADARMSDVKMDFLMIESALELYEKTNGNLPDSLDQLDIDVPKDPWGNPYQYANVATAPVGKLRKDHSLHPVNDDYDLYSKGADGKSATPFTAKISQDDIVRANNGDYLGLVSDYT